MMRTILSFSLLFTLAMFLLVPTKASAQFNPLDGACVDGNGNEVDSSLCEDAENPGDPLGGRDSIFVTIANVVSIVGGVIAVIIIIVAGITMSLSGGDPQKVQNSRNAIIYTVVGIVVIVLARSLVVFIVNQIDG